MKLKEFTETFIDKNSLIRLWYPEFGSGHKLVLKTIDDVFMDWEIEKSLDEASKYVDSEVAHVSDIVCGGNYSEAINIVILEK
jgi:hypothetical protein